MADTLREYLIELGFKVDENGWKGFNSRVTQSARNVAQLTGTTVAAALEIGVAVEKVTRQYESLYYVSQRTGATVSGLKAVEFGARQIGLTSDQARGAVEGFASAMRNNPGAKALFAGWGVDTNDAQKGVGQLLDLFKTMPYTTASAFASMAGMSEDVLVQALANREKLRKQESDHLRMQKEAGIDADKFSRDSVRFGDNLRVVQERWGLLIDRVAMGWLPTAEKAVRLADETVQWFTRADVATAGWLGTVSSLAIALGSVRVALVPIMAVLRALGIVGGAGAAGASLGIGSMLMRFLGPLGAFAWGMGLGGTANATIPGGAGKAHPSDLPANDNKNSNLSKSIQQTAKNLGIDPIDLATAISYETGGTFDKWKKGPTTQWGEHRGLIQWGEPQRKKYGVTENSTTEEQMAAVEKYLRDAGVQPGMKMMDVYSAINAGRVGRYGASDANNGGAPGTVADKVNNQMGGHRERAKALLGGDTTIGGTGAGGNVTISPQNTVNINGVSDPKKAATYAGAELDRSNGNIVRNSRSMFH